MDLDFRGAMVTWSPDEILKHISEYDIFKRYCKNFEEIDVLFSSELRVDNKPSCHIYVGDNNRLYYKDFGNGGARASCWDYVMLKFQCSFTNAISIVRNDFGLGVVSVDINPGVVLSNDEIKLKPPLVPRLKSTISILEQPYTITDYEYWIQFGISLSLLVEYNVFSARVVYLRKGDKAYVSEYKRNNPAYAYRFTRDGSYTYKIYRPKEVKERKWLFSGGAAEDIEGYDQLPLIGDTLILTKSLKDCMCYNILGYPAISLQGEGNRLAQKLVDGLLKRFNRIVVNYDNDEAGIKGVKGLSEQYGFKSFLVDDHKDLSDYIKVEGLVKAKEMIDGKVKDCL